TGTVADGSALAGLAAGGWLGRKLEDLFGPRGQRDQRPIASNKMTITANVTFERGLELAARIDGRAALCRVATCSASRAASGVVSAIVSGSISGGGGALFRCAIASAIVRAACSRVFTSCRQKPCALSEKASMSPRTSESP